MAQSIRVLKPILPENESLEAVSKNEDIIISDCFSVGNENHLSNIKEKVNYDSYIDELLASDSDSDLNEIELDNVNSGEIHNKEIENSDSSFSENKTHESENEKLEDFFYCDTNGSQSHFSKNKDTKIKSEMIIEYSVVIKKELLFSENKIAENNIIEDVNYCATNSLSNDETKVKNESLNSKVKAPNQIMVSDADLNLSNKLNLENIKIEPEEIENVNIVEPNQDEESPNNVNALYNASVQDAVRYFSEL